MGRRTLKLIQDDKVIGFVLWNDTVDQLGSCKIRKTEEEVEQNFTNYDWAQCTCGGQHLQALISKGRSHWPVTFCPTCLIVTSNRAVNDFIHLFEENCPCGAGSIWDCWSNF